ncbi:MAG TPA: VirB8/TrbF family protein [Noviherbaspirillum sp.]|nr:VirB8/TrbF family protein [Noviherbaspirillum sp.]
MNLFSKSKAAAPDKPIPGGAANTNIDEADAPWLLAARRHEDTFLRLNAQVANWRKFAFISLGIATLAVAGVIYIGAKSKFVPYLVEVDKLGRTVAVRALTGDDAITDAKRNVYSETFELIENLRTVTTDRMANNRNLDKAFSRLSGSALAYVKAELKKAPPNEVGKTKTVQVQVKTALKLTDKTWQVEWEEYSYGLNGDFLGMEKWKATLQYKLAPSGEEEQIRKNPIGYTVPELNWMKVI